MSSFTEQEIRFIANLLLSQDAAVPQYDAATCRLIATKLTSKQNLTSQDVGFLQSLLQEQSEIWGRQSNTANEKRQLSLASWVPQQTRELLKSITDKLGANLSIDTTTPSIPSSPRDEGSRSIMINPNFVE